MNSSKIAQKKAHKSETLIHHKKSHKNTKLEIIKYIT